ncbi:hypothetical protein SHELI_v1c04010 [Spiroplasma helicoides]|uniref:Lipoprotein n=1 Tax=Spiroplasma helicoides TaxID=216938 RepID=A0A1B3SK95_9MOLU|nr:hypothetical protein [Spiroplasma helicoides]AOG60352.1 hypothetical protein SHELI_v1c04010 [Spiroplasma helicoides]
MSKFIKNLSLAFTISLGLFSLSCSKKPTRTEPEFEKIENQSFKLQEGTKRFVIKVKNPWEWGFFYGDFSKEFFKVKYFYYSLDEEDIKYHMEDAPNFLVDSTPDEDGRETGWFYIYVIPIKVGEFIDYGLHYSIRTENGKRVWTNTKFNIAIVE